MNFRYLHLNNCKAKLAFLLALIFFHSFSAFAKSELETCNPFSVFPSIESILLCKYVQLNALDDNVIAVMNNDVSFSVLDNDQNIEMKINVGLVSTPKNGEVIINEDYTLTYLPKSNICEEEDTFSYFIANESSLDTAMVYIQILCEPLTILTGFSPDKIKEGKQETFTILGVENYPDNQLSIFDKWGQEVYNKKGYKNEWDGTVDDKMVSTGTYYYIFADGTGKVYSGYLNIEMSV